MEQEQKKIYYVTVDIGPHAGQIRNELDVNDPNYDFEIEATLKEIHQLEELFERTQEDDWDTYVTAHIPYEAQDHMKKSRVEDDHINQIFELIYQLGTAETKSRMEQSGMIH